MPDRADSGAYVLYHGTSVQNGLQILRVAEMRTFTPRHPDGIYAAREPAPFYDHGCIVQLHAAGVVGSKRVSSALMRSNAMVPLGLIPVINRSVE